MVRWQPAASERLQKAALELFGSRGFDETTVADIALAVGLTERTFYRYFADKREVLFSGQGEFEQLFLGALAKTRGHTYPFDTVGRALSDVCSIFGPFTEERRPYSRLRQAVILAHRELQERELLKMHSLSRALGAALRERGVAEPTASLAAESGVMLFRLSFEQWVAPGEGRSLSAIEHDMFAELRAMTATLQESSQVGSTRIVADH
ncbi:TetR family transcriptional regulator [Nakamurella sp. A5-74]|uniref:TetR family transcriptional regulator n=1 Tax=Nakamurella sp. A5-74 TaxID=3158264 RepID=A0AAU8DKP1_9ACTN